MAAEPIDGGEGSGEVTLDALIERLRAEGAAAGMWLVDIAQVRKALRDADGLLLKLQSAILSELPPLGD